MDHYYFPCTVWIKKTTRWLSCESAVWPNKELGNLSSVLSIRVLKDHTTIPLFYESLQIDLFNLAKASYTINNNKYFGYIPY